MEKHTPEPWEYDEIMSPFYNDAEGNSRGGDGTELYEVFAKDTFYDSEEPYKDVVIIAPQLNKATARRMVAAVNAVQGIPVEALENGAVRQLVEACDAALNLLVGIERDSARVAHKLGAALSAVGALKDGGKDNA